VSKSPKEPPPFRLPRNAVERINLGQSFAEYDKILMQPGVFVKTPAIQAALEPNRSKCFFVGRRGTGKTAITVYLDAQSKAVTQIHPQIFTSLGGTLNLEELRDTRQKPFSSLVACFIRAIQDEVISKWLDLQLITTNSYPEKLRTERNYVSDYDFDTRTLAFVQDLFDALHAGNEREWLRLKKRPKEIASAMRGIAEDSKWQVMVLIDRLDDTWDGSDKAVILLMALMHSCVELAASVDAIRPLLFVRENIFERVRQIDNEFTRLETCVVSLDWTKELLVELVERRLTLHLSTKPKIGEAWYHFFECTGTKSSQELVFDYCQHRPRDVLTYCAMAVESAQSQRHEVIRIEDLQEARKRFSQSRLKDLGDEYSENYPQIQLVLSRFHGLAREFAVPAVTAFIQKLLADDEVKTYCAGWLFRHTAPHQFIELLYGIGFWGIKDRGSVQYRGVGVRSAAPPPIDSATSHVVVHPSYADALDLQDKIITSLDNELLLQKAGTIIDLPDAFSIEQYQGLLRDLMVRLDSTPVGNEFDQAYEAIVGDTLKYCFFRSLNNCQPHVRDVDGRVIRDWIASNVATSGFWEMVRERHSATQVIWECKNYTDLAAGDFHQTAYYMGPAIGYFGIVCFRGEVSDKPHYYQHIRRISTNHNGGMVLLLTDRDLKVFIRQAINGKVKDSHIRELYDTVVRKIS